MREEVKGGSVGGDTECELQEWLGVELSSAAGLDHEVLEGLRRASGLPRGPQGAPEGF